MLLNELFSRLGLETDAASFAKGQLAARGVEEALHLLGEAARFVTEQLKEATLGVFEQADKLDDLATKTGVSAQSLQELGYAGQFADVSMETIAQSLRILQRNASGAVDGNKELVEVFKTLKVSLVDSTGHARSTESVFADLSDRFASMPEGMGKTNYMMKVFGKSGAEIAGVLNLGAEGLQKYTSEFRALGAEFSDSTLKDSARFEDNLLRLKTGFQGVRNTIAEAVLPVFNEMAQSTLDWFRANQDLIRTKVKEWVDDIVATVRYWVESIRDWVKEQGGMNAVIEKAEHWLKILGIAFAVFETLSFVNAILNAVSALGKLRAAIAANPIGLLITLLAIAVTMWIENWDDIKEFFEFVWDRITGGLDSLGEWFASFGSGLYDGLVQPFVDAWGWIKKIWTDGVDWIEKKLGRLGEIVSDATEILNPFNTEGNTSGTRGATSGGSAADDAEFLRNMHALGNTGAPAVTNNNRGGNSVSISSAPQINITTHPSQSNEEIGRIAAQKIAEHEQAMLREAQGGI